MEIVPKFILATSSLHNVGKYLNDNHDPEPDFNIGGNASAAAIRTAGQTKRDAIVALLMLSSGNGADYS